MSDEGPYIIKFEQASLVQRNCEHRDVSLDESRRIVICNLCDQCIEPYEYVLLVTPFLNYATRKLKDTE